MASISETKAGKTSSRCPTTVKYRAENSRSRRLYEAAQRSMPGGNTRHSVALVPHPPYAASGKGCRLTDVEGETRIDFAGNYTSAILGHADPDVVDAVREQLALGTSFTMPTESDVQLAALLVERVPALQQVRFCNSGSEAVMMALKAARAFTGRPKIAKIEGSYHGIYDHAQVSEMPTPEASGSAHRPTSIVGPSVPPTVGEDVIVLPWNHPEACQRLIEENARDLAGVLFDPLPMSVGVIPPIEGFIAHLREVTRRLDVLLISDEVLTFRLAPEGSTAEFGIQPDLMTFGKVIGGGFPVGAVGGTKEVMSVFDHSKEVKVPHGGTFNANPVTMTAGLATMKKLTPDVYKHLNGLGDLLRSRLSERLAEHGVTAQVVGKGSLFMTHFTDRELVDVRSHRFAPGPKPDMVQLTHEMLGRGIAVSPKGTFGCLSTPMGEPEVDAYVEAFMESLVAIGWCS